MWSVEFEKSPRFLLNSTLPIPHPKFAIAGGVTEWSKVLAWKASVPPCGTEGSNPSPSAVLPPPTGVPTGRVVTGLAF